LTKAVSSANSALVSSMSAVRRLEPLGHQVELPVRELDDRTQLLRRPRRRRVGDPAQHGPDPGQQFPRVEGLGQVVVGAEFQPDDAVHLFRLARQDDHRHMRFRPKLTDQHQAVAIGQAQVQQDQVSPFPLQRRLHRGAGIRYRDPETFLGQVVEEKTANLLVIIDGQNMHQNRPAPRRRPTWDDACLNYLDNRVME